MGNKKLKPNIYVRLMIYIFVMAVICKYGYEIYQKNKVATTIRVKIIDKKTNEVKENFLIREEGFYKDKVYEEKYLRKLDS